jgi:hypothetical protein
VPDKEVQTRAKRQYLLDTASESFLGQSICLPFRVTTVSVLQVLYLESFGRRVDVC